MEAGQSISLMYDSCHRDNTDSRATLFCLQCSDKLCDTCKKHHKRNKASSGHTIKSVSNVKDVEAFDTLKRLTQCAVHAEKKIKYLCKDHDQLCCNECAIVRHRKCENVVSLGEEMEKARRINSPSTEDILKEFSKYADLLQLHEMTDQVEIDETKEVCTQALGTLKKNMETAYKKLEGEILVDSGKARATITKDISTQKKGLQNYKEELNKSIQKLETVRRVGEEVHIYLKEREMDLELKELEKKLTDLRGNANSKKLVIKDTSSPKELEACLKKFITADVKTANVSLPVCSVKGIHEICPVKCGEYPLQLVEETFNKKIYMKKKKKYNYNTYASTRPFKEYVQGCIWLDNYLVVIQDNYNVVLVNILKVTGQPVAPTKRCLKYEEKPLMSKIDDNRVAIMEYNDINLYQLDSTRGVLERTCKITTVKRHITGIAYDAGVPALVILSNTGVVEFLSLDGNEVGSFQLSNIKRTDRLPCFKNHCMLFDGNSKTLYLTDDSSLLATTMEGCNVFEYMLSKSLTAFPALDVEGNIYLPMCAEGKSILHQVNPKGTLIRAIQVCECAVNFMMVCFNTTMDKFAVLCDEKNIELKYFDVFS